VAATVLRQAQHERRADAFMLYRTLPARPALRHRARRV